jgi:endonuclease YncB( thermonuclease family)
LTISDSAQKRYRVRLSGIDAPERLQRFGGVSRRSLSQLTYRKTVVVDYYKLDPYGRLVGKVRVDGADINLEQLRRGMAWHRVGDAQELTLDERRAYQASEAEARSAARGLWKEKATPPWEFRKQSH